MKLSLLLEENEIVKIQVSEKKAVWPPIADTDVDVHLDPETGKEVDKDKLVHGWAPGWINTETYKKAFSRLGPEAKETLRKELVEKKL